MRNQQFMANIRTASVGNIGAAEIEALEDAAAFGSDNTPDQEDLQVLCDR